MNALASTMLKSDNNLEVWAFCTIICRKRVHQQQDIYKQYVTSAAVERLNDNIENFQLHKLAKYEEYNDRENQ